jgi:hypothetical protein
MKHQGSKRNKSIRRGSVLFLACALAWSQDAPKAQEAKPADQPKAEAAKTEEPKAEGAKEAAPAVERWWEGNFEVGVRWQENVRGNIDTYRSIVNIGEGVRLLNWDARMQKGSYRATTRGSGWGGDPAEWLTFGLEKKRFFRLNLDHRSTAYFNALPSYGNPLLDQGILVSQRSQDTQRRLSEVSLDLLPTRRIIPFFSYSRDRGFGRGISNFVSDANEYPVLTNLSDRTNLFRGGVRVELDRLHVTLEQGGIGFHDGQTLTNGARIPGNNVRPVLGQTLFLNNLIQAYEVEGKSIFSRGLLTAQPFNWLDVSGSFQFSQPQNDVVYRQENSGNFVDLDTLLFFTNQNLRLFGAAKQPHLTANEGLELRPFRRIRLIQSITTDRLHNGSSVSATPLADRLEWTYNQQQVEAVVEPLTRVTLRGGYRYTWGDSFARAPVLRFTNSERGELKRHSALAGAGYRATDKISFNADVEIARSDKVLFRTSLSDFERLRFRGRYQLLNSLNLYGTLQYLNNTNPPALNPYEFRSQQTAMGLHWLPRGGNTIQFTGEYARATVRSDLTYLVPQTLQRELSRYRENAHTVTGLVTYRMAVGWTFHPTLSAGGSMFLSNGSRPTNFYQPVIRFSAPVGNHLDVFAEYRYYGVSQQLYVFEGFRTNQGIVGIRIR